ncbi:MAG: response regulator [Ktedonobacteraceae bacterium]|nr:response regulator [Ktedonobacteraceae bacterium]
MTKKILVVDDDEEILEAIQIALEMEGYAVKTSVNGDCFQHLNGDLPDLILLDILLTGEDGRDLCQQLKRREETRHIPVILCSAHFSGDLITYLSGASTFLPKPFEVDELLATIARYITSAQAVASSAADTAALSEAAREE